MRDEPFDPSGASLAIDSPRLARVAAHFRSPLMERGQIDGPPAIPRAGLPSLAHPPGRSLVRPLTWAMSAAVPMLVLFGWEVALMAGLIAAAGQRLVHIDRRVTFSFGDGFLPYRADMEWP